MSAAGEHGSATEPGAIDPVDGAAVLFVGFAQEHLGRAFTEVAARAGRPDLVVDQVGSLAEVEGWLARRPVCVIACGPEIESPATLEFLERLHQDHPFQHRVTILIGNHDPIALLPLVQDDRLFYYSPDTLPEADIASIAFAGFRHYRVHLMLDVAEYGRSENRRAVVQRKLLSAVEVLSEVSDPGSMEDPILEALHDLISIDSGRLWLYDSLRHTLSAASSTDQEISAVTGLAGFVARTGKPICSTGSAARDPRYDAELDGDGGPLLAVPLLGSEQRVLGVLAIDRRADRPPFTTADLEIVERLAEHVAPMVQIRTPHLLAALRQLQRSADGTGPDIFRSEAVEANASGFSEQGKVLRNTSAALRWTWAILVSIALGALIFGFAGTVHDYATGPAVVRIADSNRADPGTSDPEAAEPAPSVVGFVPGHYGPRITVGKPLRLTLDGYSGPPLELEVSAVGERVLSRGAALALVDGSTLDQAALVGPVILIEARLPDGLFQDGGESLALRDGMRAVISLRMASRPILFHLVPGLESVLRR